MNWNTTDLAKVALVTAALVGVLRAVFGRPLVRAVVNPHRPTWLVVGLAFGVAGCGLLREATSSDNPAAWFDPLLTLVTQEQAPGHVLVAAFAGLNAAIILGAVAYCRACLPKDPQSFRKRTQLTAAVQYYAGLRGGVDYAALIRLRPGDAGAPEVVAAGVNRKEIQDRLNATGRPETADDRIRVWLDLAPGLHRDLAAMNARLAAGGQGLNRRALLDVQFGGYLIQYIRSPESGEDVLFLFAVTVLQQEVTNRQFEDHFDLMVQAVRNVTAAAERW